MDGAIKRTVARLEKLIEAGDRLVEANVADEEYCEAATNFAFKAGLRHAMGILMEETGKARE